MADSQTDRLNPEKSSRERFAKYREDVREDKLPKGGSFHGPIDNRPKKPRQRSAFGLVKSFFRLAGSHRWSIVFALITLTISTGLALIPPLATKVVIDNVINQEPLPEFAQSVVGEISRRRMLVYVVVGVFLISTLKLFVGIWGRWIATRTTKRIQLLVRKRVFEQAVRLPLNRVQEIRSGGVASILREDGGSVGDLVFGMLYNPWRAVVQLLGSLAILAYVDWKLLVGAIILLPLVFFTHRTWINRIRPQFRQVRKQRENIDGQATEVFGGMRVVRAFARQRREGGRFMTENHYMARQELFVWWWSRIVELIWETLIPAASAALLLYGGFQVLDQKLSLGELMMFMTYLLMLLGPLATLAQSATSFQNSLSGLDRVLDLLEEPRELPPGPVVVPIKREQVDGAMSFRDVSFTYPGASEPALEDVNLEVEAGQVIALVGPSGAGKTTLCNLVARFYDPTSGSISLDGRDLKEINLDHFRSLLGVVEQDVFLFDGSVGANIAYSRPEASIEELRRASQMANALEFIDRMPEGFNTIIGERGVKLSGGQRQRVAIARAILADPKILILDEATSNLDTESERLIQQSLEELMQNRTSFVIAHRLSTISHADLIIVIDHGRIIQSGTHDELMQSGGRYREMVELQTSMGQPVKSES